MQNKFGAALNAADERTREIVESTVTYDCVSAILGPTVSNTQTLLQIARNITHLLLKIKTEQEVASHPQSLGIGNPEQIIGSINTCMATRPIEKIDFSAIESVDDLDSMVAEIDNLEKMVNPVRTMASDMESARGEQVYSSNQDALLQGNQTPTNPDVARWTQT